MSDILLTDDLGSPVRLGRFPTRIVSLVPSLTETLVYLGARARLAGVTDYCIHPAEVIRDVPRVGGTKNPSISRILELAPDLVIANVEENEKEDVETLRRQTTVFVTYPRTVFGAIKTVEDLATIVNAGDRAGRFADACRRALNAFRERVSSTTYRTACLIWRQPWMAAGPDTYMSDLIRTAGFENIFDQREPRYPQTSIEALVSKNPDVILLPDEPYPFGESDREELASMFARTPHIRLVDGTFLAWFGSRTLKALEYVQELKKPL